MLSRRDLIKYGLASSGFALASANPHLMASVPSSFWGDPKSPSATPFIAPLPIPPTLTDVAPFQLDPAAENGLTSLPLRLARRARYAKMVLEEHTVSLHPELPSTKVWRYRDINTPKNNNHTLGPTFVERIGKPRLVRQMNRLPLNHAGFGVTETTTHMHGGHMEARSDGFPEKISHPKDFDPLFAPPGHPVHPDHFDYVYAMADPGFRHGNPDKTERPSTLWYHDHVLDHTGPNVYRGLAGACIVQDEHDSGDEEDKWPGALRLPSGDYDVPLVLSDRLIAPDGSLLYMPGDFDGHLGDTYLVNGAVQPYMNVKRRKYRFRLLNGSNARMYKVYFIDESGDSYPVDLIATEGGLLSRTLRNRDGIFLTNAHRREVIIDFRQFKEGTELYLEDRILQDDGRGPDGKFDDLDETKPGTRLMKFIVGKEARDYSEVPDTLRPFEKISQAELNAAERRHWVYERKGGQWVIDDEPIDIEKPRALPKLNTPQLWTFENKSGGWWHPIHVHLEFGRIIKRHDEAGPEEEQDGVGKHDMITLGPNSEVEVFFKFRDFPGEWVHHCHNIEHEDHFMMARFDVVE